MESDVRPHPRSGVVSTTLGESRAVLLDLTSRRHHTLNEFQTFFWKMLTAGASRVQLADSAAERWNLSEDDANDLVDAFLADLGDRGLIE
jgi:hypothetical protein